ncbi:MAG: DUF1638 domain-containing protein [Oscillospiraceae bacterium]|nr:DUF1638 domain-containing protein [Oscillospiraceae bacterium]
MKERTEEPARRTKTVVVACRTLERELTRAMEETGCAFEAVYIESGLHERPKKLAKTLQETLDGIEADRVLLCLGQCGNAMYGIRAGGFQMISPRVDDCLSLLIGDTREKNRLSVRDGAFFMTMGWLRGETTVDKEYARLEKRYGADTALQVMKTMYAHYRTMGLLDSGVDDMDALREATRPMAELLGLEQRAYPAGLAYIRALLTGPWDDGRFIVKAPGEAVTEADYAP